MKRDISIEGQVQDDGSPSPALERRILALRQIVGYEQRLRRISEKTAAELRARLAQTGRDAVRQRPTEAAAGAATHAADDVTVLLSRAKNTALSDPAGVALKMAPNFAPVPAPAPSSRRVPAAARTSASQVLPEGFALFEYRIDGVLGQGGFGVTYLATDINLNTRVAIKEYLPAEIAQRADDQSVFPLWPEDRDLYRAGLDAFLVEARTLATFRHPNIVRVARFFELHSTAYAVLDYEDGKSLKQWWTQQQKKLPEQELLTLLHPLLNGLAVVHGSGFLHRDIKPDNIYVRKKNGSLVLLDFGSARETISESSLVSNVVTPGYAPVEQYDGKQQGPWTDLYALGATLYWMIAGAKPPPAPMRAAGPDPMEPAVEAGKGRYTPEFLRAVDWALRPDAAQRPRSVAEFSRSLFAGHTASLALHDALRVGTSDADADAEAESEGAAPHSGRMLLRSPAALMRAARRLAGRLRRPGSWPMVTKMALAMLLTSSLPMAITAHYNWKGSVRALEEAEVGNLQRIASSAAGRVSQLLDDSRNLAKYLGTDPDFADALSHPSAAGWQSIQGKLDGLVKAIPDVYPIILLDTQGKAVVSSDRGVAGRNFAFREYFREAMQGRPFMTDMVVGSTAGAPGVYYSHPVYDHIGRIVGVVALRIKGTTIVAILDETTRGTERKPTLLDTDGVLVHYPDARFLYRSLMPLAPTVLKDIVADQRFRSDRVDSLDMPELWRAISGLRSAGHVFYHSPMSGHDEVAGIAPLSAQRWVVAISESREVFEAPLRMLFVKVIGSVIVVGMLFFALAMLFARSIVRPIERMTQVVHALKRGDYDAANIEVTSDDEIGRLARTFNVMIDVLRQRDRERLRAQESRDAF